MSQLKKINLSQETICVNKEELSKALSSNKEFGIVIDGTLKYTPFMSQDIFIFQGIASPKAQNKEDILGNNYEMTEDATSVFIKAAKACSQILNYNAPHCDYKITSVDNVTDFKNEELEDMAWMIIDFDVTYSEIIKFLEDNTEGTLLYLQEDASTIFNSIAYFNDIDAVLKIFFTFCQTCIKDKLANDPDYTYDYLDEDQVQAVTYFKAR